MDTPAILWPLWMTARQVRDSRFAAAYDGAGPECRGRIKALIATLMNVYPPQRVAAQLRQASYDSGIRLVCQDSPRPFAVAVLDSGFASPAKLLAALIPALTAGVGHVAVVQLGAKGPPDSLLVAMELAGVETVARLSAKDAALLLEELAVVSRSGTVLSFGPQAAGIAARSPLARWDGQWQPARVGLLKGRTKAVESALDFMHPGWLRKVISQEALATGQDCGCDVVVCPQDQLDKASACAPLALGVDQAGFWIWPDLGREFFMERRVAIGGQS